MRAPLVFALCSICATALNTTSKGCCPATDEWCGYGQSYGGATYAQMCGQAGYKCNPKDLNCDPENADASCPSYESKCPAKCCQKDCCGAYGYQPDQMDTTCCSAASLCYDSSCDSRCNLRCTDPIKWMAHPTFVLDVNGFGSPNPPKQVMLWERGSGTPNDNELFVRDNTDPCSSGESDSCKKGWITWTSQGYCLEASGKDNGSPVNVNTCVMENNAPDYKTTFNPMQQWTLVSATSGSKIQLQNTNKCVAVKDNFAANKQILHMWDCSDDNMQTFDVVQNQWNPGMAIV